MKAITTIIGIILILFGIATFVYQNYTYTTPEKIAQVGNLQLTANAQKTISFSPVVGGASIAAGIALVIIGRINSK